MTPKETEFIRQKYIVKLKNLSLLNESKYNKTRWLNIIEQMPLSELKETWKFLNR